MYYFWMINYSLKRLLMTNPILSKNSTYHTYSGLNCFLAPVSKYMSNCAYPHHFLIIMVWVCAVISNFDTIYIYIPILLWCYMQSDFAFKSEIILKVCQMNVNHLFLVLHVICTDTSLILPVWPKGGVY